MAENDIKLKVGELISRDEYGKGIARLDTRFMKALGIKEGEIIEIGGKKSTGVIAVRPYPQDIGSNIIRIDGLVRKNADVPVGDFVKVRKANVKEAKKIVLAPAQKGVMIQMQPELLIQNLVHRPMSKGDIIVPTSVVSRRGNSFLESFFGSDIDIFMPFGSFGLETKLAVVKTAPEGITKVTDATEIELKPQAVEIEEIRLPTVTYEDIGGLGDELGKVREMIELPLRHPELFERLGVEPPKGILMHGVPGTGKTLLAKAVASESGAHFIPINGPEIVSKWYGQSLPGDEEIIVVEKGALRRRPIEQVVSEKKADGVPCFDRNGKIVFGKITDFIKHPFHGKLIRIKTASGRIVRVTDYHSLFTLGSNGITDVKTSDLIAGESLIAVLNSQKNPNIAQCLTHADDIGMSSEIATLTNGQLQMLPMNLRSSPEGDITWDIVTEVEELAETPEFVYDISVDPCENFITGSGIFAHNSEGNLRKIFKEAEDNAPSIIFIDEIDAIAPKRGEVTGEVERRMVSQLLTLMDGLQARGKVIVIAATNRVDAIDEALRRPGRFDRELEIGVPDKRGRKEILQIHTRNMPMAKDVELGQIADITYGFVGADLEALCKEAAMHVLKRTLPEMQEIKKDEPLPEELLKKLVVRKKDFDYAIKMIQPSAMREVMVEIPKIKWADIGGLETTKASLKEAIEWPLKNPEAFTKVGIKPPKGILLYGPPGCGKTMLAKAVASESDANFISIKGPQVMSKWVGESEKMVREIFKRARQVSPCIIFFDEIDSLAPARSGEDTTKVTERIVSQMLTEMSGLEDLKDVVVIAATNRPDMVDPALLRPGRFDRQVLIPAPDSEAREGIFKIHTKSMPLTSDVNIKTLSEKTEGYSGADIEAVCREAGLHALREDIKAEKVNMKHFKKALEDIRPSLEKEIMEYYQKVDMRKKRAEVAERDQLRYVS